MALTPLLQPWRMLRHRSSQDVSIGYLPSASRLRAMGALRARLPWPGTRPTQCSCPDSRDGDDGLRRGVTSSGRCFSPAFPTSFIAQTSPWAVSSDALRNEPISRKFGLSEDLQGVHGSSRSASRSCQPLRRI